MSTPMNESLLPENRWFMYVSSVSEYDETVPVKSLQVSVFPNPLNVFDEKILKFNIENSKSEKVSLTLYNIRGQRITNTEFSISKNVMNVITWDLNSLDLASGIYLVRIDDTEQNLIRRVMVLRN